MKKCEHAATTASSLKIHIEIKHEGVRYLCDKCHYTATGAGYLRRHTKCKHARVSYPCD